MDGSQRPESKGIKFQLLDAEDCHEEEPQSDLDLYEPMKIKKVNSDSE